MPAGEDPVPRLIDQANRLLDASPSHVDIRAFAGELAGLPPRELVRFDAQARSMYSGVQWHVVGKLRRLVLRGARRELWEILALVSGDGHERERAVKAVPDGALAARLLLLRRLDWVAEVREAALTRLDRIPHQLLVEALPLAEQLAAERARGDMLDALLDARLSGEDLRLAYLLPDSRVRRAAWRRLAARETPTFQELGEVAARDPDVVVRAVAAGALGRLPEAERRALAEVLIGDRVGWVAMLALAALVELDGPEPIVRALTARTAALRHAARDWAAIRDIDARGVYLARLAARPGDAVALTALAELADPRDAGILDEMLRDMRPRLRAAAIRALARLDRPAGRAAAIAALRNQPSGRVTWAAAEVLRDAAPSAAEAEILARIALDPDRSPDQRLRVLSLLRRARWVHLATVLEARARTDDPALLERLDAELPVWLVHSRQTTRGPDDAQRARIERHMSTLDDVVRKAIEFVLRTTS